MKPLLQVFALKLEEMNEFSKLYGNEWSSRAKWKKKIEDLKLKWPEEEKFNKKLRGVFITPTVQKIQTRGDEREDKFNHK